MTNVLFIIALICNPVNYNTHSYNDECRKK